MVAQYREDLLLASFVGLEEANVEAGWDAKSEHSVDVGSDDFEVHEGDEELAEGVVRLVRQLGALRLLFVLQNSDFFLIIQVLLIVVDKFSNCKSLFSGSQHVIVDLIS